MRNENPTTGDTMNPERRALLNALLQGAKDTAATNTDSTSLLLAVRAVAHSAAYVVQAEDGDPDDLAKLQAAVEALR